MEKVPIKASAGRESETSNMPDGRDPRNEAGRLINETACRDTANGSSLSMCSKKVRQISVHVTKTVQCFNQKEQSN